MSDKRIRISLAEKRKYCELIRSGASYKSLNLIFKSKHKTVLPRRTFYNWTRDKDAVLERTSTTKINLDSGRKSEAMKKFEEEIKKRLINREEVGEDTKNKENSEKTFTQPKITTFFN